VLLTFDPKRVFEDPSSPFQRSLTRCLDKKRDPQIAFAQQSLKGRVFVVPGLSEEDIQGAAKYLELQNDELRGTQKAAARMRGKQRM
jgi:hypothetical protein